MNTFFLCTSRLIYRYNIVTLLDVVISVMCVFMASLLRAFSVTVFYVVTLCTVVQYSTPYSAFSVENTTVCKFASDCTEHSAG
jgi:hypothetical protein